MMAGTVSHYCQDLLYDLLLVLLGAWVSSAVRASTVSTCKSHKAIMRGCREVPRAVCQLSCVAIC